MVEIKIERVSDRFLLYESGYRIGEINPASIRLTEQPREGKYIISYQIPGSVSTQVTADDKTTFEKFKEEILRRGGVILAVTER